MLSSGDLLAHGEKKPGPHGGQIRMPGAFHTELIKVNARSFRVYLLDIEFKNPEVKNSQISATLVRKNLQSEIVCSAAPDKDYFECVPSKNFKLKKGDQIRMTAKRQGVQGAEINYSF